MKKRKELLFKFKYPKTLLLIISIILAYIIFKNYPAQDFILGLKTWEYLGSFIAGILFSFGFTAPIAVGFFVTLNPENILLTAIIGGIGATISNLLIFSFIRISFKEEFERLEEMRLIKEVTKEIKKDLGRKISIYLGYALAGFLIASPLPNEIGDIMLAEMTKIKTKVLVILSFILSTLGILILLWI